MSKPAVTTADFKQLAELRIEEAGVLLQACRWSGAYYLAGYAVEIGLKACIIRFLMSNDAFPLRKYSEDCWTHDLKKLVAQAGLKVSLDQDMMNDSVLSGFWGIASKWSEKSRYDFIQEPEAKDLFEAITDQTHGVLKWVKKYW